MASPDPNKQRSLNRQEGRLQMMYYVIENGTLVFHKTHDWDEARAVARAEWERSASLERRLE